MVLVDYYDVLQGCADLCGVDRDTISTAEQAILRNVLSKRLTMAWNEQAWPDLLRLEQRYFRATYNVATAYSAGTEVYFTQTQNYYRTLVATTGNPPADAAGTTDFTRWALCLTSYSAADYSAASAYVAGNQVYYPSTDTYYQAIAGGTGNLPTDPAFWGALTIFDRYVSKDAPGQTAIGTAWWVWDYNRRVRADAKEVVWFLSQNGIQVLTDTPYVWVEFKIRAPHLWGNKWSATTLYTAGQQVFYRSAALAGNFYTATAGVFAGESPETTPGSWARVELPYIFKEYLEAGGAADYLTGDDNDQADRLRGLADNWLANQSAVLLGQEGQTQRTIVLTR